MDPQLAALLEMLGIGSAQMPEYSVSKGWQPVDIGTQQQNLNYRQDYLSSMVDPIYGALTGAVDPSAFDPVAVEQEAIPEPETPYLSRYGASQDPVIAALRTAAEQGEDPLQVVKYMEEKGLLPAPTKDANGKEVASTERDYYLGIADQFANEQYALQTWQRQSEQQAANPKFEDSKLTQKFNDLGIPLPTLQYTPESFQPDIPERAAMSNDMNAAYEQAVKSAASRRDAATMGAESDAVKASPRSGNRIISQARQNPMGPQREVVRQAQTAPIAHLAAMVAQKKGGLQADSAAQQGRTPFRDFMLGRAGL